MTKTNLIRRLNQRYNQRLARIFPRTPKHMPTFRQLFAVSIPELLMIELLLINSVWLINLIINPSHALHILSQPNQYQSLIWGNLSLWFVCNYVMNRNRWYYAIAVFSYKLEHQLKHLNRKFFDKE